VDAKQHLYGDLIDMKQLGLAFAIAAAVAFVAPAPGRDDSQEGHGRTQVTVLPSAPGDQVVNIAPKDIKIKVDGKESNATSVTPLRGTARPVELVLLIDGSARASLGEQFTDINHFVSEMPAHAKIGIAYMQNGRAEMSAPPSSDPAVVLKTLHLPAGSAGSNGSPYFCLSDLAKHWPSNDRDARRVVAMITDGVDNYERRLDLDDPYVNAAINDSVRAGIVVYSMYWQDAGRLNGSLYQNNAGQTLLQMVTQATGGYSYWQGIGNPVSFGPYFDDLRRRLNH